MQSHFQVQLGSDLFMINSHTFNIYGNRGYPFAMTCYKFQVKINIDKTTL